MVNDSGVTCISGRWHEVTEGASRDDTDLIPLERIQTVTNIQRPYNT
jgi:hypothetical protein